MALDRKCIEWERIIKGFKVTQAHVDIAIECLKEVKVPAIGKYDDPTDDDRQHFKTAHKPNWEDILQQEIKRCQIVTG